MPKKINFHLILFFASLAIFLLVLLFKIEDFPIYFFIDEAIQAVKAETLLQKGFRNRDGDLFPLIMNRFNYWDLGLTVYLNLPGLLLFGKKIWVVRGTTVLFSLLGGVFTALILKNVFKIRNYWVGILYLVSIPMFFLHSRTGFEIVIATSFYAGFIYFYLLYRTGKPFYLLSALFFAALAFYSVNALWLVIIVTLAVFALLDLPFHLKNPKIAILSAVLCLLLFAPFLRWQIANFAKTKTLLSKYNNPLAKDDSFKSGLIFMAKNYSLIFNPAYLFFYHPSYHPRHYLKGYGYFPAWSIPVILLGLIYLLKKLKNPGERTLLVALFLSPLGGALVEPGPSRIMALVIPATCLFGLGIKSGEILIAKLNSRFNLQKTYSLILFISLYLIVILMTNDSLKNGPFWFRDYGLYGMQYGARQMLTNAKSSLSNYQNVVVSTGFANGLDVLFLFFLNEEEQRRIRLIGVDQYLEALPTYTNTVFILDENEYLNLLSKPHFYRSLKIIEILPTPDNQPHFFKLEIGDV